MFGVIPAAGLGTRLDAGKRGVSKVLLELASGVTLLELAIRNTVEAGVVEGFVVAVRPSDRDTIARLLKKSAPGKTHILVDGGDTRQESVFNALRELHGRCSSVLIQDAARPFSAPPLIREVVSSCARTSAAILAVPVVSTLKQSRGESLVVEKTVPRAGLWEAQTPQCFSYDLISRAHRAARESGYTGTDDASLVERLGHPVTLVRGSSQNIKITTPEDLELGRVLYASFAALPKQG